MLSRRQFCVLAMGAGSVGLGMAGSLRNSGQRSKASSYSGDSSSDAIPVVSRNSRALGTEVSITVRHADRKQAERAVSAAFDELKIVEQVMSLYLPESQLCRLNRERVLREPHPYLVEILQHALTMSEASGGAFDVTVQPLWEVWAEAWKAGGLPDPRAIAAACAKVHWRRIEVLPAEIRLHGPWTKVTLNGIAQGFAADRVVEALRRHAIEHALVNTGEIAALRDKSHGEPWAVGIQHPRQKDAYLTLVSMADRCLATSGDYATPPSKDYRDHHLFDPTSGRSPGTFSSVSVVARTACEADALSTAVFVLGAEKGLKLVRSTPGCDALLVFKDGRVLATEGFPAGTAEI